VQRLLNTPARLRHAPFCGEPEQRWPGSENSENRRSATRFQKLLTPPFCHETKLSVFPRMGSVLKGTPPEFRVGIGVRSVPYLKDHGFFQALVVLLGRSTLKMAPAVLDRELF